MDNKKDIGKAFKDKLDQLQASPKDIVWDKIVAELDKKEKKRRVIPIWFKVAGIAVVLLTISGLILLSKNHRNTNDMVNVDNNKTTSTLDKIDSNKKDAVINKNTPLVSKEMDKSSISKDETKSEVFINELNRKVNKSKYLAVKNSRKPQIFKEKTKDSKQQYQNSITNNLVQKNRSLSQSINNLGFNKNTNLLEFTFAKFPLVEDKLDMSLVKSNIQVKTNKKSKIKLAIKGSPIFYSTISNGSSIDKMFDGNGKTSDVTSSYGVQTSLQISDKISFRTGISKVDLAYNTHKATEKTIINAKVIDIKFDRYDYNIQSFEETPFGNIFDLKQQINYFEIPLEFTYKLIDNRINVNVISGFSALLLNGNQIIIDDEIVGKANNLNKLSYSGNLGLGFNYKLTKHLNLNMEPIYKLQFRTYSNNVNFKPYYFGVYSGFTYKF